MLNSWVKTLIVATMPNRARNNETIILITRNSLLVKPSTASRRALLAASFCLASSVLMMAASVTATSSIIDWARYFMYRDLALSSFPSEKIGYQQHNI
jgi:hypothetical protein